MAKWYWPVPGYKVITSGVGPRWEKPHNGIDIGDAGIYGADIVASRGGTVITAFSGCNHDYAKDPYDSDVHSAGKYVVINHKDGYVTRYLHMSSVLVSEGAEVSAGQVIGKVGTTGWSTGPHLHFEIIYNGIIQDPEDYVSPTNSISSPSPSTVRRVTSSANIATNVSSSTAGTGVYTPVMTSEFTKGNPMYAYVRICLGDDKELKYEHGKPSIIQSFEINRLDISGCTAQMVLFDDNWDEIEYYFSKHYDSIKIKYGYSDGYESPEYIMILQDYSIDFKDTGTILSISAISEGIYQNLNTIVSFDTGTKNPAKAIEAICKSMGWSIDYEDFDMSTKDVDRLETYKLNNENPVTYINSIIEEAQSNGEILSFSLEPVRSNGSSSSTAHLKLKTYGSTMIADDNSVPTYVYQKGYDSVIRDMSFNVKGVFGGTSQLSTVTQVRSGIFDIYTKKETSGYADQYSVLTTTTGNYSATKNDQSLAMVPASGITIEQMNNKLYYYIKNAASQAYEATMTILGDPRITILQEVRIVNVTDYGRLHHTSGIYLVKGITDTVENGEYLTTLTLIRGNDISEGIELVYPKDIRK